MTTYYQLRYYCQECNKTTEAYFTAYNTEKSLNAGRKALGNYLEAWPYLLNLTAQTEAIAKVYDLQGSPPRLHPIGVAEYEMETERAFLEVHYHHGVTIIKTCQDVDEPDISAADLEYFTIAELMRVMK